MAKEATMAQPDEDLAPGDHLDPEERDIEAPEADAVEQAMAVGPDSRQESLDPDDARVVDFDDDYR
jgi:hypothetical protein